jgi:hypothetical protein
MLVLFVASAKIFAAKAGISIISLPCWPTCLVSPPFLCLLQAFAIIEVDF